MTLSLQTVCRACGSKNIFDVADFGMQVPANSFRPSPLSQEKQYPLLFRMCGTCWLGQLGHVVPKEELYSYYPYITSTSKTMANHLEAQCQNILSRTGLVPRVVEVGSNTGAYLKFFKERHSQVFGFEPAMNLATVANEDGIPTVGDYFTQASAMQFSAVHGKADVLIGRHVLAHIDCWRAFVSSLDAICAQNCLIVLEVPYLIEILQQYQFDTVYHEHLSYVSLKAVYSLLEDSPFYVQDVERSLIHGGSVVFYIRRRGNNLYPPTEMTDHLMMLEESSLLGDPETWASWAASVKDLRDEIREAVWEDAPEGWVIGYGASAKGSMLLQYCGLKKKEIEFVTDNTPAKQGKFMPGSEIPIVVPSYFVRAVAKKAVGAVLILAWNFAREIKKMNPEFKGRWITPIPQVRIEHS